MKKLNNLWVMVGPEALTKTNQNKALERLTIGKSTVECLTFLMPIVELLKRDL